MKTELDTQEKRLDVGARLNKLLLEVDNSPSLTKIDAYTPTNTKCYVCAGGSYIKGIDGDPIWNPCKESLPQFPLLIMEKVGSYTAHMFHSGDCCINFIQKHFIKGKIVPKNLKRDIETVDWTQYPALRNSISLSSDESESSISDISVDESAISTESKKRKNYSEDNNSADENESSEDEEAQKKTRFSQQ